MTNATLPPALQMLWNGLQNVPANLSYAEAERTLSAPDLEVTKPDPEDCQLAQRLLTAYVAAEEHGAMTGGGLWDQMSAVFHKDVRMALSERSPEKLATILSGFFQHPISAGICRSAITWGDASPFPYLLRLTHADVVYSLAAHLGVAPAYHGGLPDVPSSPLVSPSEGFLDQIEETLGFELRPPQAGGIFGLRRRNRLIPYKYLYQAGMAKSFADAVRLHSPHQSKCRVLEIGGGVGFLSHILCANFKISRYTIIDLPIVNLMQGYYLLKSDLAPRVRLFGEASLAVSDVVEVMPTTVASLLEEDSFDIALNQDSLPEMDAKTISDYLDVIAQSTTGLFLSINHEAAQTTGDGFTHGVVGQHILQKSVFQRLNRSPFWLRKGYVEELFKIEK